MADATSAELRISLKSPPLACHGLGRCQHWLYFSDVHRHHPAVDSRLRQSYPFVVYKSKQLVRTCEARKTLGATRITHNDRLALPTFSDGCGRTN